MRERSIAFAGRSVRVRHGDDEAAAFLDLLFPEMRGCGVGPAPDGDLELTTDGKPAGHYALNENGRCCAAGSLGVSLAAVLFDRVIFHLLDRNSNGVALHAGAVGRGTGVILLPGESGAGKSTLTAWLGSRGFSCLTDELVFLDAAEPGRTCYFSRPLHIKPGAKELVKRMLLVNGTADGVLEDQHGMIVPRRAISSVSGPAESPPSILLFPTFRIGAVPGLEKLSPGRAGSCLMSCNVNGRNLEDHGFGPLMALARSAPAFRLVYGGFDGLEDLLAPLLTAAARDDRP